MRSHTATAALILSLMIPVVGHAATVPGTILVKDDDTPAGTLTGGSVITVTPPYANPDGSVGNVVRLSTQEECILLDGVVQHCEDPLIFDDSESSGGSNSAGQWVFQVEEPGTSTEVVVSYGGILATEQTPAFGYPPPAVYTFISRPMVKPDGTITFLANVSTAGTTSSDAEALYVVPDGDPGQISILLRDGDIIDGLEMANGTTALDTDHMLSDNGQHYIIVSDVEGASTTEDAFVAADGRVIAREGDPGPLGGNWDNFDVVNINDLGNFVMTGDTDGATDSDEFIAYNGVPFAYEGDTIGGVTLATSSFVNFASINNNDEIAFAFSYSGGETVFVTCDPTDPAGSTRPIVSEDDDIDVDGDGVGDWIIDEILTSNTNGGNFYSDNGFVFFEATLDAVSGTPANLEALVRFPAQCCPDADADGQCDIADPCPTDNPDDTDGDGVCESDDLCLGDDATGDTDGDGVCDDLDACPVDAADDSDGDGFCDSDDLCDGDDLSGDADGDGICNDSDFGMLVSRVAPLDTMTFFAFGVPPGQDVQFAVSPRGLGDEPCVNATCGNLLGAIVVGSAVADGNGYARLDLTVPGTVRIGLDLYFQALYDDGSLGDVSEIVTRRTRPPAP